MSRIPQIELESATGKAQELLTAVKAKMGMVPNLTKALANAPAALNAYLQFSGALGHGLLNAKLREQIAITVAQTNTCDYCLAAHTTIGKMVGLSPDQIRDSRLGKAADPKADAIVRFSKQIVENRGRISDCELQAVRNAGLTDGEITEVVANVSLNIFTNYFNHIAETVVDFPKPEALTV